MDGRQKTLLLIVTAIVLTGLLTTHSYYKSDEKVNVIPLTELKNRITDIKDTVTEPLKPQTDLAEKNVLNVLLLGIDRRSKQEYGYRTDIMILISFNKLTNRIVMISVPRDLWVLGGRINALYVAEGFDGMQNAFEEITGLRPDRFVLTDFEDFSWIVDALGGVEVNVETTFTDSEYPVDATKGYQTISFTQGPERLTGERALIFARSRKGDNDNGDWGRMKRQHLILRGMIEAITQKESIVCKNTVARSSAFDSQTGCENSVNKETIEKVYTLVTNNRMDSNFAASDLLYLWDFYKDRHLYTINSIFMDYQYVFSPPMEEYGGAWVLAPISGTYDSFKADVRNTLEGNPIQPVVQVNTESEVSTQ